MYQQVVVKNVKKRIPLLVRVGRSVLIVARTRFGFVQTGNRNVREKTMIKIESGIKVRPEYMIIYGPPGVGKSKFASDFPNVLFANVEDRLSHLDVKSVKINTWEDLIEFVEYAKTSSFDSIAFDTLDAIELIIRNMVAKKHGVKDFSDIPDKQSFQKWEDDMSYFKVLANGCNAIRNAEKNVVITCHSEVKSVNDPMTVPFDRYQPKVRSGPFSLFRERVDDLFFVSKEVNAQKNEERGFSDGKRYVFTEWNPAYDAKRSFEGVPDKFELKMEHPYQYYLSLKGANKDDTFESVTKQINGWKGVFGPEDLAKVNAGMEKHKSDLVELVRLRNKVKEYMDSVIKGAK